MTEDDLYLAYMAGFFDADGSAGIYAGGNRGRTLRVQITQLVSPESSILLDAASLRWGGCRSVMSFKNKREAYNWQANGVNGHGMLIELLPHLKIKRAQAELAIEWWEGREPQRRNERGHIVPLSVEQIARNEDYDLRLRALKRGD